MRAVLALALSTQVFGGWIRLQSAGVELLSDAGEKSARAVLDRLQEVRSVFEEEHPVGRVEVRVFLFRSEAALREIAPTRNTKGFFQSDPERDVIVLQAGEGVTREAAHEFVHLLLSQASAPLPAWFEEGTADLYSNLSVARGRASIGAAIPTHVRAVQTSKLLSASELRQPGKSSEPVFYPEAWALVHYFSLSPEWQRRAAAFRSPEEFLAAIDADLDSAIRGLPSYLNKIAPVVVNAPSPRRAPVELSDVSANEASILHAEVAVSTGHVEVAKRILKTLPMDSAAAETARAMLAVAVDRRDEAMVRINHALTLPDATARTYYEAAALEQDRRAPWGRIKGLLEKATEMEPLFGEAQFLLGSHATDDGEYAVAIERLGAAVKAKPRNASYWNALAYAQAKAGQPEDAKTSARAAVRTAQTEEQERMAQSLLESLN